MNITSSTLSSRQGLFGIASDSEQTVELALLRRIQQGDNSACADLLERYRVPLFRWFYGKTANRDEAEDFVSDTLTAVWLQLSCYTGANNASFRTYVFSIAKNKLIDWLRKKPRTPMSFSDMGSPDSDEDFSAESLPATDESNPLTGMLEQGETDALCCALADMALRSPDQLAAAALHYGCEMSHKEIAALYGMSPVTVNTRLQEARRTLKRHYEREAKAVSTLV